MVSQVALLKTKGNNQRTVDLSQVKMNMSLPREEAHKAQKQAHKPSASSLRKWEGAAHRQRL